MATYEKTTFVDGAAPAITANELNKIGNGILEAINSAEALATRVTAIESSIGTSGDIGTKVANSLSTITWDDTAKKLTKTTNGGTSSDVFTKADLGITIADTTGIVPVNRGGTGVQTFTSNAVLYGNGTNGIGAKASANGALYATQANGSLSWGTLPIAQGGTGKTSASEAWTALGGGAIGKKASLTASDIPDISTAKLTSGTLGVARGGTGLTANPSMLTNLGSTSAANVFASAPRPGVTGTLGIGNGGTGLTSSPSMLTNLGSTSADNVLKASPRPGVTGTLGIGNGGTGATTWSEIRNNLYIGYGTSLPTTSVTGHIFFKY